MKIQNNCDRRSKRENCQRLKAIQIEAIMKHIGAFLNKWGYNNPSRVVPRK
ncbi:MAG: hypothetical protein HFJ25_03740 [Clostridia bacterium]|nr:hypothetical protein [Clostridia bacterium]